MKKNCSGCVAVLAFLLVFPLFLRRKWRVARRVIIPATPAEVFPFINDMQNWPLWMEWTRRNSMEFKFGDKISGTGAELHWESKRLSGTATIFKSAQDDHVAYEIVMDQFDFSIEAVLALEPMGGSTRVTWLCKWDSGANPYMRYADIVSKLILKNDFDAGLENLRKIASPASRE